MRPDLIKEWHLIKNGNLKPTDVTAGSSKRVWWLLSYDVPMDYPIEHLRGKHFDFEWKATIDNRSKGYGCPYLSKPAQAVWKGFNDLATVNPELAKQWHPSKNIGLKNKKGEDISAPDKVTACSNQKVWWLLPYDVPHDYPVEHLRGKRFCFEWKATINNRKSGNGCPYLTGNAVYKGFNDLVTMHPYLAKQWHPTKNIGLTNKRGEDISSPDKVTAHSEQRVWWLFPYDVPMDYSVEHLRGKHFDFEWQTSVKERSLGEICPFLTGHQVWKGFNDLATTHPKIITEWDYIENTGLTPSELSYGARNKVFWKCDNGHKWKATINSRTITGHNCPVCSNKKVVKGVNDLITTHPELAKEWHPVKNVNLTPDMVTSGSGEKVWWLLPYNNPKTGETCNFEWKSRIADRSNGAGCPFIISSGGENSIRKILKSLNIKFEEQYKFKDRFYASSKYPLKDDFAILNKQGNVVGTIEFHGQQHYKPVDFAGEGKKLAVKKFNETQKRDAIKTKYLQEHNIPQLIIPYTHFNMIDVLVKEFLYIVLPFNYN